MWALLHQNILGQQQKALQGEQVGQGWEAVLSFLPAPGRPDEFQPLLFPRPPLLCRNPTFTHHLSPGTLPPPPPSFLTGSLGLHSLGNMGAGEGSRYERLWATYQPCIQKQNFILNSLPLPVPSASGHRPKAVPPSGPGADLASISALPLPTGKPPQASSLLWDLDLLFCNMRCNDAIIHLIRLLWELNKTPPPAECLTQDKHWMHGSIITSMFQASWEGVRVRAWGCKENLWPGAGERKEENSVYKYTSSALWRFTSHLKSDHEKAN